MQAETVKRLGGDHRGPDSTSATSQPHAQSAMSDQKSPYDDLKSDEPATCAERRVHINGQVADVTSVESRVHFNGRTAGGACADPSTQEPSLSRWYGQGRVSLAISTYDMTDQSMAVEHVLSQNGSISDVMQKSPVRSDGEEGGDDDEDEDNDDDDNGDRSRRGSETQKAGVLRERKKNGGEGGGGDDFKRGVVYRLMGSTLTTALLVDAGYLAWVAVTSQYLYRRFAVEYFNLTNVTLEQTPCASGENSSSLQDDLNWLQAKTSQQLLFFTLALTIPNIIVSLLVGSYSDYFGRKFLILGPLIGAFLGSLTATLVIYLELDVSILYVAYAVDGVLGSVHVMKLGLFAAIADVTISSQQRVLLYALVGISMALAGALSQIGTGFLIDASGFAVPSLIITCLFFLAFLCILVFMPETLRAKPERLVLNPLVHLRKVFSFYIADGPLAKRVLFICGQIIMFIVTMINLGRLPVEPLFEMNSPLCWGPIEIGIFTGVRLLLQNLTGVAALKVMSRCVLLELIGMLGLLSGMASFIVQSMAEVDLMMYISALVGILTTVAEPVVRTLMSRMVPADSQEALFASLSATETFCSFASSLIYNNVYTATLDVFVLMAALLLMNFILLVFFTLLSQKYLHFQEIQIEVDQPDPGVSPPKTPPRSRAVDETAPLLAKRPLTDRHQVARLRQQRTKL